MKCLKKYVKNTIGPVTYRNLGNSSPQCIGHMISTLKKKKKIVDSTRIKKKI
jgi:hypothetical protein